MPVCDSEKLGLNVLGHRTTEKAEHVPIKKRRFVRKSPSLPPRSPSPHSEETVMISKTKPGVTGCSASTNDLGHIVDHEVDVEKKNLKKVKSQVDESKDFLGISLLAAAACCKDFGGEDGHTEDGSGVEESFVCEGPSEPLTNNESCTLLKGVSNDDICSTEIPNEGTGSCFSALPPETVACMKIVNSSATCLSLANKMEDDHVQDQPVASEDLFTSKNEETVRKTALSSRDDRLHWDLNRAMDLWEHPLDYQGLDSDTNVANGFAEDKDSVKHSCKMGDSKDYELRTGLGDSKTDAGKILLPGDSRKMAQESKQSKIEEHEPHVFDDYEKSISLQENMISSVHDGALNGDQFEGGEQCLQNPEIVSSDVVGSVLVPADDAKRISASINEDQSTSDQDVYVQHKISNDHSSLHGVVSLYPCGDNNLPSKSSYSVSSLAADEDMRVSSESQVQEQEGSPLPALSGNTTGGIDDALDKAFADANEISAPLDVTSNITDVVASETCQPLKTEHLDNFNENQSSSDHLGGEMPPTVTVIDHQPAFAMDLKVQDEKASVHVISESDTKEHINRDEAATKCTEKSSEPLQGPALHSSHGGDLVNSSDRMTLEEPLDYFSDVSHDNGDVKSNEQEVAYDSQYEDGEVRESIVHALEEYDGEDMDVDYGSDNANNLTCDDVKTMRHTLETNFQPCLSASSGSSNGKSLKGEGAADELESGAGPSKVTGDLVDGEDDIGKQSLSADSTVKLSGGLDHRKFSDSMPAVGDGGSTKNLTDGCMDVHAIEGTKMRMMGSREFRRELRSHIVGRSLQDGFVKDNICMQRSSDLDNSNPRSARESGQLESFGRVRYSHHAHARGEEGDHWVNSVDSHRGLKRYRSPKYYGPTTCQRVGPENASSDSVFRCLRRSGSPVDRDEAFCLPSGFRPSRVLSSGRHTNRGRGRHLQYGPWLDERGPMGRYHGPMPDDSSRPSLNHSYPSKRERCLSPVERRGEEPTLKSHSKSPQRSRTRSPNSGYPSSGAQSKSPNFRSDVRMQRGRSPHQRSDFIAGRMAGFRKMHRNYGSLPHYNSRWDGDWKDGMVHVEEQARTGPRDGRFDFVDFPRNYRSMHNERFLEMERSGRGRPRFYGDGDIREKHGQRFGQVLPGKRLDMDGPVKRFQYNGDEDFVKTQNSRYGDAAEFYGRGGPRQIGRDFKRSIGARPRSLREGRGPFVPQKDGKHDANSKSFGLQESGEDENAHSRRPS